MSWKIMIQTAVLLAGGQSLLGSAAWFLRQRPVFGLALAVVQIFFIIRTAGMLRHELAKAERRSDRVVRFDVALLVAMMWQIPTVLGVPIWSPDWASQVWFGSLLTVPWSLGILQPGDVYMAAPYLGLLFLVEMIVFIGVATWSNRVATVKAPPSPRRPSGNVAVVRRFEDAFLERAARDAELNSHEKRS